jgi:peptide/nickel transport system ATP-binding protein
MSAIPPADPDRAMQPVALVGEPPDPAEPPPGCRFHNRCRYAEPICRIEEPQLRAIGEGRLVACHRAEELTLAGALELDAGVPGESLGR